jgi:hypothetical protein
MALRVAEITVTLREVDLGNRPDEMMYVCFESLAAGSLRFNDSIAWGAAFGHK